MALCQRAVWLAEQFTLPATRAQVTAVIRRLEAEIARLDGVAHVDALPGIRHFLPETTARLDSLTALLRTSGRHARPLAGPVRRLDEPPSRARETRPGQALD